MSKPVFVCVLRVLRNEHEAIVLKSIEIKHKSVNKLSNKLSVASYLPELKTMFVSEEYLNGNVGYDILFYEDVSVSATKPCL